MVKDCISEPQRKAIEHKDGPMMVLAGPGSGKTFVITRRIRHMIKVHKIDPSKILVITFTKNSAVEMQERFESLMDNEFAPVTFGTFHAVYFNIIKEYYNYDFSNIITEKEKREYMKIVIDNYNQALNENETKLDSSLIPSIISDISKIKNSTNNYKSFKNLYCSEECFYHISTEYNKLMRAMDKVDFDDMVVLCKDLLSGNQDFLAEWKKRFQYILIDEFQDINQSQYDVIKMIIEPLNNLFVVGDDDQAIYGFRGSCPEIMLGFMDEFPDAKKVLLDTNYRCNRDIVVKAVSFIENNKNRYKKLIRANKESRIDVKYYEYNTIEEEGQYIIKLIKTIKRKKLYSDIALIYRTNNAARFITKCLQDNKIPYKFKEKPASYFNNSIAKDIISIIAFANGENTRSNFLRFMNKPVRYISRDMLNDEVIKFENLFKYTQGKLYLYNNILKLEKDINAISKMNLYEAFTYICKIMRYEEFIKNEYKKKNKSCDEIDEILVLIKETFKNIDNYKDLKKYITEYEENLNNASIIDDNKDCINIVTMHGSKGLEYHTVIIPDVNEGYLPQPKAKTDAEIEEERRVFYVAMTRAKENLYIMNLRKNSINRFAPSRFLKEIKDLQVTE